MDAPTQDSPPLDFRNQSFLTDPYPTLARLRAVDPVHLDAMGIWCILRHADVAALNRDPRLGRDLRKWFGYPMVRPYLADSPLERCVEQWMFSLDPPDHTRLRKLVARAFTPRALEAMRRDIEREAEDLLVAIDAVGRPEEIDLMAAFAQPFPVRVIARVLGIPADAYEDLRRWSAAVAKVVEPTTRKAGRIEANANAVELMAFLKDQVARRRQQRTDDVISVLIAAADDGDQLTEDEVVSQLVLMFIAGHETTTNLIGNGMLALCRNPNQMDRLRAEPGLMPSAIEELLRFDSPANTNARVANEDIVVGGKTIEKGQLLLCMLGAANRDPEVFVDPDRLDVSRSPNPHQSFGGGIHFCIGAALSRLEGQIAFDCLLRRFKTIDLIDDEVRWRPLANLRGLERLMVRVSRV